MQAQAVAESQFDESGIPLDLPEKDRPLYSMFVESTGCHFLDSGGSSRRNWQQNRRRDLRKDPEAKLLSWVHGNRRNFDGVRLSLYHFLNERVEYEDRLTKLFERWCRVKASDKYLPDQMEGFVEWLQKRLPEQEFRGPGDSEFDADRLFTYTYNEENALNQDFQFVAWSCDDTEYYLIPLHGGADARGGFTDAKVFTGRGCNEWSVFDYAKYTVGCDLHEREEKLAAREAHRKQNPTLFPLEQEREAECHYWDCDGYGLSSQHYPTGHAPDRLDKARVILAEDHDDYDPEIDGPGTAGQGDAAYAIVIDREGKLRCPAKDCGCVLSAWPWCS